jgi:hypothetical protein
MMDVRLSDFFQNFLSIMQTLSKRLNQTIGPFGWFGRLFRKPFRQCHLSMMPLRAAIKRANETGGWVDKPQEPAPDRGEREPSIDAPEAATSGPPPRRIAPVC